MTNTTTTLTRPTTKAPDPASEAQINWLTKAKNGKPSLLDSKDWQTGLQGADYERAFDLATGSGKSISKSEASGLISALLLLPSKKATPGAAKAAGVTDVTEEGHYMVGDTAFKVQRSARGNLYAKRWINTPAANGEDRWTTEYAEGAMAFIRAEHLMTPEEQVAWSKRNKHCIRCGDRLIVPASLERGMGPVCYKRAFGL